MTQSTGSYLLAGQPTELERLQLQSRVWEPAGRALLAQLPGGSGLTVLDVGCGVMGGLRILSEWVRPEGSVVGSDIDDKMLASARSFLEAEALSNVRLLKDDLFSSQLPAGSFRSRPLAVPDRAPRAGRRTDHCLQAAAETRWLDRLRGSRYRFMARESRRTSRPAAGRSDRRGVPSRGRRRQRGSRTSIPLTTTRGRAALGRTRRCALARASILATAAAVCDISSAAARTAYWEGRPGRPGAAGRTRAQPTRHLGHHLHTYTNICLAVCMTSNHALERKRFARRSLRPFGG